ncbi:hypothetical protein DFH07DRAFT_966910 [Mycena maculata]|uniref:CxC2-like cysteine cluster KDZ transposase-associated domain-containing protein n=1 Tax=Mycena maculata TaxID=230809 RepID=A0AAD7MX71_9AGAR|nr:hypothetical protein DFH07DRAFT_966910 [Mycena maculata]
MHRPLKRKKKPTTIHLGNRDNTPLNSAGTATTSASAVTKQVLREKTRIRQVDGVRQQTRGVLEVAVGDEPAAAKVHPDVPKERPSTVFDLYSEGDSFEAGVDVDAGQEGGRSLRDSDDPLRQWSQDHRTEFLAEMLRLEGRGDHAKFPLCPRCNQLNGEHRCKDCLGGGELLCTKFMADAHRQLPFHKVERWIGSQFERISLKKLGVRIQLGHWHGAEWRCSVPVLATDDDFVIIYVHGIHEVGLDYCGCGRGGATTVQLLRASLWAAMTTNPKTAATFAVLNHYQLLSYKSKCSVLDFYQALARETDNMKFKRDKERYHSSLLMTKEWWHSWMLKRSGRGHDPAGIENTRPGECALLCPPCPHPGKNLPPDWQEAPDDKQFLYALFLAMDANFRLKRKDVSSEEKDPGLCKGWAFFCEVEKYMTHVTKNWCQKQARSHCIAHNAVDKPDREARGTASSGVGAVDCAHHNMKRPNAVGDLQLGERYLNMDYMFFVSIVGSPLMRFFVSYDIACQWHINIWK